MFHGPSEGNARREVEAPTAKGLVFRFLRSMRERRTPVKKPASTTQAMVKEEEQQKFYL